MPRPPQGRFAKQRVTLTLDRDTLRRLDRVAKAQRRSRSSMVGDALAQFLGGQEQLVAVFSNPDLAGAFARLFGDPVVQRHLAASMRAELSDDQLRLFAQGMDVVAGHLSGAPPRTGGKRGR